MNAEINFRLAQSFGMEPEPDQGVHDQIAELRQRVAELEQQVAAFRRMFEDSRRP